MGRRFHLSKVEGTHRCTCRFAHCLLFEESANAKCSYDNMSVGALRWSRASGSPELDYITFEDCPAFTYSVRWFVRCVWLGGIADSRVHTCSVIKPLVCLIGTIRCNASNFAGREFDSDSWCGWVFFFVLWWCREDFNKLCDPCTVTVCGVGCLLQQRVAAEKSLEDNHRVTCNDAPSPKLASKALFDGLTPSLLTTSHSWIWVSIIAGTRPPKPMKFLRMNG